jgi:hypothetical protein
VNDRTQPLPADWFRAPHLDLPRHLPPRASGQVDDRAVTQRLPVVTEVQS